MCDGLVIQRETFWRVTLFSLSGVLLWALHFGFIYLAQHLLCALQPPGGGPAVLRWLIVIVTLLFIGALTFLGLRPAAAWRLFRANSNNANAKRLLTAIMRLLACLSFFAVLWAGVAMLFVPLCTFR